MHPSTIFPSASPTGSIIGHSGRDRSTIRASATSDCDILCSAKGLWPNVTRGEEKQASEVQLTEALPRVAQTGIGATIRVGFGLFMASTVNDAKRQAAPATYSAGVYVSNKVLVKPAP